MTHLVTDDWQILLDIYPTACCLRNWTRTFWKNHKDTWCKQLGSRGSCNRRELQNLQTDPGWCKRSPNDVAFVEWVRQLMRDDEDRRHRPGNLYIKMLCTLRFEFAAGTTQSGPFPQTCHTLNESNLVGEPQTCGMFTGIGFVWLAPVCQYPQVGMTIEQFNSLIQDVHQRMREDAHKEALR
jgi:hypothetical protein